MRCHSATLSPVERAKTMRCATPNSCTNPAKAANNNHGNSVRNNTGAALKRHHSSNTNANPTLAQLCT